MFDPLRVVLVLVFVLHAVVVGAQTGATEPSSGGGAFDRGFVHMPEYATAKGLRARMETPRLVYPGEQIDLTKESFHFVVPAHYKPLSQRAEGDAPNTPFGLLVWVSPSPSGQMPEVFRDLLAKHNLIWVSAHNNGNGRHILERAGSALCAAMNAQLYYDIDPERVYISGLSGGGRTASMLAGSFSDIFRGCMPLIGCNFYREVEVPRQPGKVWRASASKPKRQYWAMAKNQPLVIVTGSEDFNQAQCSAYSQGYKKDGYKQVTYIEVPGMEHTMPPPEVLDEGLGLLDVRVDLGSRQLARNAGIQKRLDSLTEQLQSEPKKALAGLKALARSTFDTPAGRKARQLVERQMYPVSLVAPLAPLAPIDPSAPGPTP